MTITPLRDPALAILLTGLVNSRIQSRHGNDFAGTFKLIDVAAHLNKKSGGGFLPDTLEGSHKVYFFFHQFPAHFNEYACYLLKGVFKVMEQRYLLLQNHVFGGTLATYRRCLLYTSDAADDLLCVDLGGRRIIK